MAKTKKATKAKARLPTKADKPAAQKDRTGKASTGHDKKGKSTGKTTMDAGRGDKSNTLPKPRVKPADVRTLQTLIKRLPGMIADSVRHELQQHEKRAAETSAPTPPSPHEEVFAELPELISQIVARLARIEAAQQPPARDPSLDVPASVTELRRFFAGACKTLAIHQPAPAIIGRIMHDKEIFSPDKAASPRNLFELIYAKKNIPDHLSQQIRGLLGQYGNPQPGDDNTPATGSLPADQQQRPAARKKRTSASLAKQLGPEFDKRFDLIVNTRCGDREPVRSGGKTNYHRYLNARGRDLFNEWPDWADATGGIRFADEMPSPAAPPAAAEPTPPPPQPPT
jgi:hypothetical protein